MTCTRLAQPALDNLERDTVLQAVGRVRPYTKPREIITFQCAAHPQLNYTAEFDSLEDTRKFFGILSRRATGVERNHRLVQEAKGQGLSQRQVAKKLGLSRYTVQRHWSDGD